MNDVKKFHPFDASVDGVLKLNELMWVLIKQCKVRDCNLDIGTVIFKPDIIDYPNADDLLVIDSIPDNQKDLHFKGKVLAPNNPYIYYEDLVDTTFNVIGADYLKDKLPTYGRYDSVMGFKRSVESAGFNIDALKAFAGKGNMDRLMGEPVLEIGKSSHCPLVVMNESGTVRYLPMEGAYGLFLKSEPDNTEFAWLSPTDIQDLHHLSKYGLTRVPDMLGSNTGIVPNNEFGATIALIHDAYSHNLRTDNVYDVSEQEFNNMVSAIDQYCYDKKFESKIVDGVYDFKIDCPYTEDQYDDVLCEYKIAAYDDILPSGVGVRPFNVILSEDFFVNDIVDRTWIDDDGKVIYNDTIKEFVVEDVVINFDSTFIGKAVLKDGSIKHDVNIKFDDYIENVYPFTLELTQRSLVARYIKNNGYNVDFDKLSYDLGIRPKLIESTVSRFNHFYRDEEQQPVNLTYFDKGGKYLGDTQSEIDSLPSVSDIKSVDNGIDR